MSSLEGNNFSERVLAIQFPSDLSGKAKTVRNHRFDDVLVDFYLSDQVLAEGGLIAFDDMWMPSVRTVQSFILSNRKYEIVPQPVANMIVMRKLADDDREWAHFQPFHVAKPKRSLVSRIVARLKNATHHSSPSHRSGE